VCAALERQPHADDPRWRSRRLTPGAHPLLALARATADAGASEGEVAALARELLREPESWWRRAGPSRRSDAGTLYLVDQLEELVTRCAETDAQRAFALAIGALARLGHSAPAGLRVLLVARDDFLARLGGLPGLGEALEMVQLVRPLEGEALRGAVVEPAAAFGYRFEDERLVERVLGELRGGSAPLPLLQFALEQLWQRRDGERKLLTAAALDALGGVGAALARSAEDLYLGLERRGLGAAVRRVLLALLTSECARRARPARELATLAAGAAAAVEELRAARLIVGDEQALELAHEALARAWERLRRWLDEERELRELEDALEHDARRWRSQGQPRELLWRGGVLERARALDPGAATLSEAGAALLRASLAAERAGRLRRAAGWGALALAVVAGGALYLRGLAGERDLARRSARAEREARQAEHQLVRSERLRTAAERASASAEAERRRVLERWVSERRQLEADAERAQGELRAYLLRRLLAGPPPANTARDAARGPPASAQRIALCLFGPAADLSMGGGWAERLAVARARLSAAGYRIGCEYPYVRSAVRFRAAARRGELQHAGALDAAELARLLALLRELYPALEARRVPARSLFRTVDVLVPESAAAR
jgi:hypothetical protein